MQDHDSPVPAALAPDDWHDRDYRQSAADIDAWVKRSTDEQATDDATQLVAKLGITRGGEGVIVMSRAHDTVIVPPPARRALAAFALHEQPYAFTQTDVEGLRRAAEWAAGVARGSGSGGAGVDVVEILRSVADRLGALLPPPTA